MMDSFSYRGREHRVFAFHAFSQEHRAILVQESYARGGTLAVRVLEVTDMGGETLLEPWGMLTVNLEALAHLQSGTDAFVKTYSENEGWAMELALQVGTYLGVDAVAGHAAFPLFRFGTDGFYVR